MRKVRNPLWLLVKQTGGRCFRKARTYIWCLTTATRRSLARSFARIYGQLILNSRTLACAMHDINSETEPRAPRRPYFVGSNKINRRFLGDHLLNTGYNLRECSEDDPNRSCFFENWATCCRTQHLLWMSLITRYSIVVISSARSKHRAIFFIVYFQFSLISIQFFNITFQ